MQFKYYDLLANLVPGFVVLIAYMHIHNIDAKTLPAIQATVLAYIMGYFVNAFGSLLEPLYYKTWGGRPSSNVLSGDNNGKLNSEFYQEIKNILINDCKKTLHEKNKEYSNNEQLLFNYALNKVVSLESNRVADFNAIYAFSRGLLTSLILITPFLLVANYTDYRYYILILLVLITWNRAKKQAYYFVDEVLMTYYTNFDKLDVK